MNPEWKRIAGIHVQEEGQIGSVWMAHDKSTDTIHLYDACIFRQEVLAVIGEGLNARGRWIPIAWQEKAKDMADKLLERGCNMLPDPSKDTESVAEVTSREIWERMRTGRFKVDKRLAEWLDEYKTFYREESKVPQGSHPLMSATRHAISQIDYAKRQGMRRKTLNHPRVTIL